MNESNSEITATPPPREVASEAGREALSPGLDPSPPSTGIPSTPSDPRILAKELVDQAYEKIDPPRDQGIIPSTLSPLERAIELILNDPAASDKMDLLERMFAFEERRLARQAEIDFNEAMNRCQEEIQPVARETENTVTNTFYAKLEAIDAAIRPIYLKYGFSLSDDTVAPLVPGNIRVECRVARGGHVERFYREAPPDTLGPQGRPNKTTLHGGASTETFLRRYLRCGVFNVVFKDMDNDGNGAMSQDQVDYIVELMGRAQVGAKFLKLMKAKSVDEMGSVQAAVATIAASKYDYALRTLEEQIAKKEKTNDAKAAPHG
jgi:hypothetical protein